MRRPDQLSLRPCPVPLLRQADAAVRLDVAHRRGDVHRVARGVFAPTDPWSRLTRWDRYLARVPAHALTHPDAVFALESAAVLLGVPVAGALDEVHVLSDGTAGRLVAGVRTHVTRDRRDLRTVDGLILLSPEETAVDLARMRHRAVGLMAADAVRLLDRPHPDVLIARNEARASSRGRDAARWALSRATPLAESALESVSRAAVEWLGYPPPDLQVIFRADDGTPHRADMYWPDDDVIGEADGRVKYDGTLGDGGKRLWDEKQREDALRRRVAGFARWGHEHVMRVDPLDTILRSAGLRHIHPRESGPLLTLRRALTPRQSSSTPRMRG
ncbi:hypothetical protein [Microbacterium sp. NPDC096154]|uniref:hypothetical protein n=1 Tax=Microbacterium sp. NPDC096154 TaxID=3155549 RepID=UPI003331420D